MWTAWPYASPGATTFPCGSVAVVPATATYAPTRTAREYPTIGSQRAPDATFFRSMEPRNLSAAEKASPRYDASEALVPHRRDRVPAGQRDARLHKVPDDGEEALELLRSDRKVPARRQRDEGLAGPVEHVDRGDAFLDRRRPAERLVPVFAGERQDHDEDEDRRDDERGRRPAFVEGGCQGRAEVRAQ